MARVHGGFVASLVSQEHGPWGLCGESGESGAWSTAGLTGSSKISGVLALAPVFTTRNIVSNNNNDVIMT